MMVNLSSTVRQGGLISNHDLPISQSPSHDNYCKVPYLWVKQDSKSSKKSEKNSARRPSMLPMAQPYLQHKANIVVFPLPKQDVS